MHVHQLAHYPKELYSDLISIQQFWEDALRFLREAGIRSDGNTNLCDESCEVNPKADILKKMLALHNLLNRRFSYQSCDVLALLHEVIFSLQNQIRARNIQVRVYGDASTVGYASPELLKIIFHHLLQNAIAFSKQHHPCAYIEVNCSRINDQLRISVEDNGMGIPAYQIPLLFRPFNSQDMLIRGKGLGLYLVKRAIDLLGGNMQVESMEGCYTKMTATLPFVS